MALIILNLVSHQRFPCGHVVMSAGIAELVQQGQLNAVSYLRRHVRGDWGDLGDNDRRANDAALNSGDRLLSCYQITPGLKLWIITEWDRSMTTLLLPSEY